MNLKFQLFCSIMKRLFSEKLNDLIWERNDLKMKRYFVILSALLLMALLTACDRNDAELSVQTLATNDMEFTLADASNITVHSFSLGTYALDGVYWNEDTGEQTPASIHAPLDGIIAIPEGAGVHPLVVLIHGNLATDAITDRVYAGFDFLVQQLAAEGYVAMSINVLVDYDFAVEIDDKTILTGESINHAWAYSIFNAHMESLVAANAGEETAHHLDLTGRIILDRIHMVGHSRGGRVSDMFYRFDRDAGIERIRSLSRITTAVSFFEDVSSHPSIPVTILMSEFDGDLLDQDGQFVFDEILEHTTNTAPVQITYLQGANHNFFNRFFENDDREIVGKDHGVLFARHESTWLTRKEQENFIKHFVSAFLSMVTGESEVLSTFNPSVAQPVTMFGFPVRASTYLQGITPLEITEMQTTGNAVVESYVQEQWGSGGLFTHPLPSDSEKELYFTSISWTDTDAAVTFIPQETDFSKHRSLSLYVAVDSSNELNPEGQNQSFSLSLTDISGARQTVIIPPETAALYFHIGEKFPAADELSFDTWLMFMPVGELRVPLSYFADIDLSDVASITLQFDQTPFGAVMLSNMFLK